MIIKAGRIETINIFIENPKSQFFKDQKTLLVILHVQHDAWQLKCIVLLSFNVMIAFDMYLGQTSSKPIFLSHKCEISLYND